MNILKHSEINEEINKYFQIDGTWEFENTDPVKGLLADMRKQASQLFDLMVQAKEGSGHQNLHGAILGLKKELSAQREKVIRAVQEERNRIAEAARAFAEGQRREAEVGLAKEANQIAQESNGIAKESNGIAVEAKNISDRSLFWAKAAVTVSVIAIIVSVALHLIDKEEKGTEISKQINASEYRSALVSEAETKARAELSAEQKI